MIGWKIRAILLRHESCFGTALRRMHNRQPRGVVLHAQEAYISFEVPKLMMALTPWSQISRFRVLGFNAFELMAPRPKELWLMELHSWEPVAQADGQQQPSAIHRQSQWWLWHSCHHCRLQNGTSADGI